MSIRTVTNLSVLGIAMLIGVGGLAVHARQNEKPGQDVAAPEMASKNIAVVDMEGLYNAAGDQEVLEQKANEIGVDIDKRLTALENAPYLTQDERVEYVGLINKATPDAAQQARMSALKALSDQRAAELQALQFKKMLTPEENTRLNELVAEKRALDQQMPGIQEMARDQQEGRVQEFRRAQLEQLRVSVAQVAKQQGFANVFDANALVYSNHDLTPQVLEYLKKESSHRAKHTGN